MAKRTKESNRPVVNELANYLVTESARELDAPDRATREQLSLIMTEANQKRAKGGSKRRPSAAKPKGRKGAASKSAASKSASRSASGSGKTRRKKTKKKKK